MFFGDEISNELCQLKLEVQCLRERIAEMMSTDLDYKKIEYFWEESMYVGNFELMKRTTGRNLCGMSIILIEPVDQHLIDNIKNLPKKPKLKENK